MLRTAAMLWLLAGAARAGGPDGPAGIERLELAVGETTERDVGFALGLLCDDTSIVRAELLPATPESNTFRVTGLAEGTTLCRAGTAPARPAYLFEIHVVAAHRRA
jgi:hypothetical protein